MPELPEVETTRRGIARSVVGRRVVDVVVREPRLRRRVPARLGRELRGATVSAVRRRGKYLLLDTDRGAVIVHLGMSGSLRRAARGAAAQPHDHLDFVLDDGTRLRLRDPRRFGLVLWTRTDPLRHPLLKGLGPEPLERGFDGDYLYRRARGRRQAVKQWLMDGRVVAGVGNIYAAEALFAAGIHPLRPAGRISLARCRRLAAALKEVLRAALAAGGTTLRDYSDGAGRPGYFRVRLSVYGREGEPCRRCGAPLRAIRQGQRATCYCPRCQR